MQEIDLSNHYFLKISSCVNDILMPVLSQFNLSYFRYLKVNKNGARIHLSNNNDWTSYFYKHDLYKIAWFDRFIPSNYVTSRSIWDERRLVDGNIVGLYAREIFKIYHGFSIVKNYQNYYEVFDFATTSDNVEINNVYMRSPEIFDDIIFFFMDKAKTLLIESEKHSILLPMEAQVKNYKSNIDELNYSSISKFHIEASTGRLYLTRREYDCLSLWVCGKTAKQIGIILGLSFRTIETHLENIKGKFNIQYKDRLSSELQLLGLFEALVKNGLRLFLEYAKLDQP